MARSILPSTWRKAAHAKQKAQRASRRAVSQVLARLEDDPSEWDDVDGVFDTAQRSVRLIVQRRRSADKVAPFIRWAVKTTEPLPKPSRLDHLRGLLPKGLIGRHALSHLMRLEPFNLQPRRVWRRVRRMLDNGHVANVLRHVLEVRGGHQFVNDVLARHAVVDHAGQPMIRTHVRLLLGVHDVVPFLSAIARPELRLQRVVIDALCRALWDSHFDVEAAAALLESPIVVPAFDHRWTSAPMAV